MQRNPLRHAELFARFAAENLRVLKKSGPETDLSSSELKKYEKTLKENEAVAAKFYEKIYRQTIPADIRERRLGKNTLTYGVNMHEFNQHPNLLHSQCHHQAFGTHQDSIATKKKTPLEVITNKTSISI